MSFQMVLLQFGEYLQPAGSFGTMSFQMASLPIQVHSIQLT